MHSKMTSRTFTSSLGRGLVRIFLLAFAVGVFPLAPVAAQTGGANLQEDLLVDLDQLQEKWVSLAEAIAWDQYDWAPMEGTRTVGDVFMHLAGANVMIPNLLAAFASQVEIPAELQNLVPGAAPPMPDSKAGVIAALDAGFANARAWLQSLSDEELLSERSFFGQPTTTRTLAVFVVSHAHEHLGQQIAYARSNGVVPPWSAPGG